MQYSTSLHIKIKNNKDIEKVDKVLEIYQIIGSWNNKDFISNFELSISNDLIKEIVSKLSVLNCISFATNSNINTDSKDYIVFYINDVYELFTD